MLRLAFLGADSFWLDEAFSVVHVVDRSTRELWAASPDPNHPSLYFVILQQALQIGGTSETVARLPSALASVCSLPLLFVLGIRLGVTRATALSAVVLLALAPLDVWYAQEARMYAMVTTAGLLFAIALTIDSWVGAALTWAALTLALYLDFTLVPLSAGVTALWLVRWWLGGRRPLALVRVGVACAVAWWCARPIWTHLGQVVDRVDTVPMFVNARDWFGLHLAPGTPSIVTMFALTLGLGIGALLILHGLRRDRFARGLAVLAGAGFIACTVAFAAPRAYSAKQYIVTGWPFVVLAVTWLLTDRAPGKLWRPIAVGVSLVAAVVTVATPRADWRGVVAYLNGAVRERSVQSVQIDPWWNTLPYDYYRPAMPALTGPLDEKIADVCLVAERYGKRPPTSPGEAWLDAHSRLVRTVPFARLEVRCYAKGLPQ